jgi:hypothetical protein
MFVFHHDVNVLFGELLLNEKAVVGRLFLRLSGS